MEQPRGMVTSLDPPENEQSTDQHDHGHPELDVGENGLQPAIRWHDARLRINEMVRQAEKNCKLRSRKRTANSELPVVSDSYAFWVAGRRAATRNPYHVTITHNR
jgi:hypothetical protein